MFPHLVVPPSEAEDALIWVDAGPDGDSPSQLGALICCFLVRLCQGFGHFPSLTWDLLLFVVTFRASGWS